MLVFSFKQLVGGRMLKDLGHRSQVSPLVRVDLTTGCHVDNIKAIRSYDSWVHVPIVQEVSNNLSDGEDYFRRENSRVWVFSESKY